MGVPYKDHEVGVIPDVAVPISVDRNGGQPLSGRRLKLFSFSLSRSQFHIHDFNFSVSAWLDGMLSTNPRPGLVQMVMERMGGLSDKNPNQEFSIFAVEISLLTVGSILVIVVVVHLCYRFGCQLVRCCRPDPMARTFDLLGKAHWEEDLSSFPSRSSRFRAQVCRLPLFYGRFCNPPPLLPVT